MSSKFCNGCNRFIRSRNWCTEKGKYVTAWTDRCNEESERALARANNKGDLK